LEKKDQGTVWAQQHNDQGQKFIAHNKTKLLIDVQKDESTKTKRHGIFKENSELKRR